MDQSTKAPSGTPIRWVDPGADAVRRHSFSVGDPIRADRRPLVLDFEVPGDHPAFNGLVHADMNARLRPSLVYLDDGRSLSSPVGEAVVTAIDCGPVSISVRVTFHPWVTPEKLAGGTLQIPLLKVVERETLIVSFGPPPAPK